MTDPSEESSAFVAELNSAHRMSYDEFVALHQRLCTWGPDREPDERGALAAISAETVLRTLALVDEGLSVSMARDLDTVASESNPQPTLHYMVELGDQQVPEPQAYRDFVGLEYHGRAVTHLDALCHMAFEGKYFGGVAAEEVMTTTGSTWGSARPTFDGVIARAVLVDLPRMVGGGCPMGTAVTPELLEDLMAKVGLELRLGDALVLRSGADADGPMGRATVSQLASGLTPEAFVWAAERGVAILGSDTGNELRPPRVEGVKAPIHALSLTAAGVLLLDNLHLERFAEECAARGRYEAAMVFAPLPIVGGTGSPLNPIAIF
ncbi:cyclase family protein [Amycolatopsis sp. NPDC051372]|uniref:cyclase family protein n=1 Tax=Amycolatopsis sp. NPDC051372 TaxID=3155669 RepID=UPI0034359CA1